MWGGEAAKGLFKHGRLSLSPKPFAGVRCTSSWLTRAVYALKVSASKCSGSGSLAISGLWLSV